MDENHEPESVADLIQTYLKRRNRSALPEATSARPRQPQEAQELQWGSTPTPEPVLPESVALEVAEVPELPPGRYDGDIAEFPMFRFFKPRLTKHDTRLPLVYTDTISGKDGTPVTRQWTAYPSPFGFGGSSTHALLFDLFQLYAEQGFRGTQIQFGTLRALFQRRGSRHPSNDDYARLRRDIKILCGYRFDCKNAFWDREKQAYVDMDQWGLFTGAFYFKEKPNDEQQQLPFCFVSVHPVLQQIARTRGFFALGFDSPFFHTLKPLEQRLAIYLAKKFTSQTMHRRFVEDLAKALPIEAARPDNVRKILKAAATGLLTKKLAILASFAFEKSQEGRWLAVFRRKGVPRQDTPLPKSGAEDLGAGVAALVDRIIDATGNAEDRRWWTQCAKRLGQGPVDRALGQLKETCQLRKVRNPGAMLSKIFKDLAKESGLSLWDESSLE